MIAQHHINNILLAVEQAAKELGSKSAVARKCDVSPATITNTITNEQQKVTDAMWTKIATALGYSFNATWNLVDTANTAMIRAILSDAQRKSLCLAIADDAGMGKSASLQAFKKADTTGAVFYIQCKEWSAKDFSIKIAQSLGLILPTTKMGNIKGKAVEITDRIIAAIKTKSATEKPILILDEADKLKPSALRIIIPLYNELTDSGECAIVLTGTRSLEKKIKSGIAHDREGFDEIDSRLGRIYLRLRGANKADFQAICNANGLESTKAQNEVWQKLEKRTITQGATSEEATYDLRKMKRLIEVAILKQESIQQ